MKLVELGRVAKPHGVRGEVKVRLHWGDSEALSSADSVVVVWARADGERERTLPMRVEAARRVPDGILLKLGGVDDRDRAAELRGAAIAVARSSLPEPPDGEYYLADLVGARLVAQDGDIGEIVDVRAHPTLDTLVVRTPDGSEVEQIVDDAWIEQVDLETMTVRVSSREGLI